MFVFGYWSSGNGAMRNSKLAPDADMQENTETPRSDCTD